MIRAFYLKETDSGDVELVEVDAEPVEVGSCKDTESTEEDSCCEECCGKGCGECCEESLGKSLFELRNTIR